MFHTAITNRIHLKQFPEETYYLPDKADESTLVAKVTAIVVRRFVGVFRLHWFLKLISTAVVTLVIAVIILVTELVTFCCAASRTSLGCCAG